MQSSHFINSSCRQIVFLEMNSRLHMDHLSTVMDNVMLGCRDIFNVLNQQVMNVATNGG